MSWDYYYPKSSPRPVKDGIKASSKRGAIGEQWWSKRFLDALHQMGMDNRLARGRTYARKGQVMKLSVNDGVVDAEVQGSRTRPYEITIGIRQWDETKWNKVVSAIADQAIYSAQMLAGEMPCEIEEIVKNAGLFLFPKGDDLDTDCSCPDYANPCKHIAAVYYILAEQFDKDPFLIFAMRGKSKEDLLEALRVERGEGSEEEVYKEKIIKEKSFPELTVEGFFTMRRSHEDIPIYLTRSAEVKGGLIRSLGASPCRIGKYDLAELITLAYEIAPAYVSGLVHGDDKE